MRFFFLALFIILVLGSWFRIEGVLSQSFAFTYDVGRDLIAVNNIVHLDKIPLIGQTTGLPGLFYGPWWYYILTIPFIFSSGNPSGIAFFMALSGVLTFTLGFFLGKKIGGDGLGLLFASFLAFSPTMIGISSQIWNPNLIPLFILILLFLFHNIFFISTKKARKIDIYFLFIGIVLGLILDSEVVFGLLFSLGIIASTIILLRSRINLKQYLYFTLGFLIILSPRIAFDIRHNFLMTNTVLSFFGKILSFSGTTHGKISLLNSSNTLFTLWKDTMASGNLLLATALLLLTTFLIIIFYKKMQKEEKYFISVSLIILTVFLVGLSFFPGDIWGHYIVGIPVIYILIFSITIFKFIQAFRKVKIISIIAISLLVIFIIDPKTVIDRIKSPNWEGDASLYRNQLAVVDSIYGEAKGRDFNYAVYTPPIYDYTYKYLFSWYGKRKYGYEPRDEKADLFFLIMEPDSQYPFRLSNWLEQRKGDGKIINEEKELGNIILQTRIH